MQSNAFLISMILLSTLGMVLHTGVDYLPKSEEVVNGPLVFGIIILLQSIFGAPGITETPKMVFDLMQNVYFKFATLMVLAFAAARDFEDTIFLTVLFLGITQLIRTKEERERHPYIL
jgi:hypothetical protein